MAEQPKPDDTQEMKVKIVNGFNKLRKEQRYFAIKIQEFESDIREHKLVIEALKEINDPKRGCYRLVGGVLVGRTVGEILPSLEKNIEQIKQLKEQFKGYEREKGKEINDYMQKFNLKFGEEGKSSPTEETEKDANKQSASAVLVGQ